MTTKDRSAEAYMRARNAIVDYLTLFVDGSDAAAADIDDFAGQIMSKVDMESLALESKYPVVRGDGLLTRDQWAIVDDARQKEKP